MGRIGPNEVRGGPNRVSAQRRRRLCRALRGALCGVLREGVRGVREVVWRRRVRWNRAGCGTTAGGECCGGGSVAAGGLSGWRADGVAGRRSAGVVVVSCGWSLARLLRDCCGRLAGCGGSWVQAGAAVAGTCCGSGCFGEGMLRGRNAWGLPVLLRYGAADGCGGVDRKAGFLSPGRAIGMESRRGTAAERAVVMKGRGSGRGGCREPTAGIAVWMV